MNQEEQKQKRNQEYNEYIKKITPVFSTCKNMFRAFWVGGLVCVLGQVIQNFLKNSGGLEQKEAGTWTSIILIAISITLTGFNLFGKIAKYAGAGVLVPITGFANGVSSSAIEYKKEGQVFGIGAKIFTIAGPVILYGVLSAWCLGVVYWVLQMMGIVG